MILLPKQLHTYRFVADTKELGLDSEEFSQTCERLLTWRGKDSRWQTWSLRWKRVNWMQPLCSRTLRHSHTESFVDEWTSYLEASRASPSVLQESVKALKTRDICSPTSETASQSADLDLFSWKTSKGLSPVRRLPEPQFLGMSLKCWNSWVTEQRQEYSQRLKSVRHTKESGCLSWPTPTAAEGTKIGSQANYGQKGLSNHPKIVGLPNRVKLNKSGKNPDISNQRPKPPQSKKLNPVWVEQLMGIPVGWTDLDSLVTE